jgi:hypothetical protein
MCIRQNMYKGVQHLVRANAPDLLLPSKMLASLNHDGNTSWSQEVGLPSLACCPPGQSEEATWQPQAPLASQLCYSSEKCPGCPVCSLSSQQGPSCEQPFPAESQGTTKWPWKEGRSH